MKTVKKCVGFILCVAIFLTPLSGCRQDKLSYADNSYWAYHGIGDDKKADVFLIAPTVDMGEDFHPNMSLEDSNLKTKFVGSLNMQKGIYEDSCRLYSPYYRQVTYSMFENRNKTYEHAVDLAYRDIKDAFDYYLGHLNKGRPFVLAGFSQGGLMTLKLLEDYGAKAKFADHLVEAYVIGWPVTQQDLDKYPHLKMAQGEYDTGSIVSFNSEAVSIQTSMLVPDTTKGINPLNWKTNNVYADKSLNLGACFTDYSGNIISEIPQLTGAYLDEHRGTLKVIDVNPKDYHSEVKSLPDGVYHLYDYKFFYRNLQKNVNDRINQFTAA